MFPPYQPTSTLFPYTTLFRSLEISRLQDHRAHLAGGGLPQARLRRLFDGEALAARQAVLWVLELVQDPVRSEEHTSELQSRFDLVCRLLLEKNKTKNYSMRRT